MSFFFPNVSRHHDKRIDTWYSDLTVNELKQLCKAATLSYSGNKGTLIEKLSNHHLGELFIWEASRCHPTGLTNKDLQDMCAGRGVSRSGSRYDLVCRLLQHESNELKSAKQTKKTETKKRTPLLDVSTVAPKKPRLSQSQVLYNRIQRKINSGATNKRYDSHMGSKAHSGDVYELLSHTLTKEIMDKGYAQKKPRKAVELAKALFTSLMDGFQKIISPGYDNFDSLGDSVSKLETIMELAADVLSDEEKTQALEWVEKLSVTISPYGFTTADGSLEPIMELLSVESDDEESDDDDDQKPKALATTKANKMPPQGTKKSAVGCLPSKENQVPNLART